MERVHIKLVVETIITSGFERKNIGRNWKKLTTVWSELEVIHIFNISSKESKHPLLKPINYSTKDSTMFKLKHSIQHQLHG